MTRWWKYCLRQDDGETNFKCIVDVRSARNISVLWLVYLVQVHLSKPINRRPNHAAP